MKYSKYSTVPALILLLFISPLSMRAQINTSTETASTANESAPVDRIIDVVIEREKQLVNSLRQLHPLVETYLQNLNKDNDLGSTPKNDRYSLGKLALTESVKLTSLTPTQTSGVLSKLAGTFTQLYTVQYLPGGFAQMIMIDDMHFDRQNYQFEFVRREFLGEVRTMVFEVKPTKEAHEGSFSGQIWVEDQGYNIVRFNGTYGPSTITKMYFHFDSWRENMGNNMWLPAYVYSEESDLPYFLGRRKLQFKAQTRLFGYSVGRGSQASELTALTIDADGVDDHGDASEDMSPVLSLRAWERQAEDNVVSRLQKAGVMAPSGEVDKVLQTVVNNLLVTNELVIEPEVRVRVLLTSPIESFTIGHTIVLSRGLIDVLPDEASLAMVLAHELAHIALGHRLDTKYAFNDRMLFDDEDTFRKLIVVREKSEEIAADKTAQTLLRKSPYAEKLGNAGLFLRAVNNRARQLPNLLRPHMGNRMVEGAEVKRMADLIQGAPELQVTSIDQIAALPLGGRVRVDPWTNEIQMVKSKPVGLLSAREKMPFEVTPIFLYLTRQDGARTAEVKKEASAQP